jgi:hypothetical protein
MPDEFGFGEIEERRHLLENGTLETGHGGPVGIFSEPVPRPPPQWL